MATLGVTGACFPDMDFYQSVLVRSGNDLTLDGGTLNANALNAHQGPLSLDSASGIIQVGNCTVSGITSLNLGSVHATSSTTSSTFTNISAGNVAVSSVTSTGNVHGSNVIASNTVNAKSYWL